MKAFVIAMLLLGAGCAEQPASTEAQSQSAPAPTENAGWHSISEADSAEVASAKSLCARMEQPKAARSDPQPPAGGLDSFTRCMLEQANKRMGLPAFEELCSEIPGSRLDAESRQCFVVSF